MSDEMNFRVKNFRFLVRPFNSRLHMMCGNEELNLSESHSSYVEFEELKSLHWELGKYLYAIEEMFPKKGDL